MYNLVEFLLLAFSLTISNGLRTNHARLENITRPEVRIPQGTLQGIIFTTNHKRNISGFLGIPYGQPPIGDLRFASPVAANGWNGTRDGSIDVNMCPQIPGIWLQTLETPVLGEEDCLHLNAYTPQLPETTNSSLLPVMVFLHGGGFVSGSAQSTSHNPDYLLDEDVVLVVPNYRLGALGFLSTGDEVAPGNWALKDQVLALKWVQDNIKYFGGDPDQVTLFGSSAGSASVHLLTLSTSTIGLFHRYIMQSGSALSRWAHQPRVTYASRAFELGEYVGCSNDTSDSLIECLRTVNVSDIIASRFQFYLWESIPYIVWSPTDEPDIEGAILTDSPTNLFAAGKIRDLPSIIGVVRDEGLVYTGGFYKDGEMFNDFLEKMDFILPELLNLQYQSDSGAAWVKAMKSYYFNNDLTTNTSELLSIVTKLLGDALFHYPAYNALRQQFALVQSPQYFYTFNYQGTYSKLFFYGFPFHRGVAHGDDSLYLFSPEIAFADYNGSVSETDRAIVNTMVQLWTSFAINGTPTSLALNGTTAWEPYSTEENYLRVGNESDVTLEIEYSLLKARMEFWTALNNAGTSYRNSFVGLLLAYLILFWQRVV